MRDKQIFLWINLLIWLFIQEVNGQNKIHGTVLDANGKYPLIGSFGNDRRNESRFYN